MLNLSWVLKMQNLMLFSNPLKIFKNIYAEKVIYEKIMGKLSLCLVHKFSLLNFLGESFLIFSMDSNSESNAVMKLI